MADIPAQAREDIIRAGRRMDERQWVPATAGNISVRIAGERIAITRSGQHKGFLSPESVIEVDLRGRPLNPADKPSAETLLHCQIYEQFEAVGAVVHGHSVANTVLSMVEPRDFLRFENYEILKIFENQPTHEVALDLPLFSNSQDMVALCGMILPKMSAMPLGYLIRGHGVYVWGADMDVALARLEALEFLLACELAHRGLK